jgi:hypothetical protein
LTALAGAVITVAAVGWAGSSALGANTVGNPVLSDCNANGVLTHNYTLQQLRHALAVMPASYKEYGNCQDVIQAAVLKVKAGKQLVAGSGGSGGSFLPTPVIVILVVLILAAVTFGALAVRRRRSGPGGGPDDGDPPDGTPPPPTPPPPAAD